MSFKKSALYILFAISVFSWSGHSQCLQIESILVDACGSDEGLNEMVRFKVGPSALSTNTLAVSWPNNPWRGLIQNTVTNAKTAALNADIIASGGCGQLLEPVGGIIPANASVILVTSFNLDTALNSFGALTQTFYIIYQNNPANAAGHFANFGSGVRTLTISAGSCSDSVTYNRALLTTVSGTPGAADGAIVEFSTSGAATYINNGCAAPVPPFSVNAGLAASACAGSSVFLSASAQGHQTVLWTASSGTFSNAASLNTTYNIDPSASGNIVLTLSATNTCGTVISDTVTVTVLPAVTPNFATALTICSGSAAPALNNISGNGIVGSWNPSTISNTLNGTYTFTPAPGQCAVPVSLAVTVSDQVVPNFPAQLAICNGGPVPALAITSPDGITGSWSPNAINNTQDGIYTFTPDAGQCAAAFTLTVTVSNTITPDFPATITLCSGSDDTSLSTTSPNGITGTWNPSVISNQASGLYTFTPDAGQCAVATSTQVIITPVIVPDFETEITFCNGQSPPALLLISPNGVSGTWNPVAINGTQSGSYIFTPDANQCAQNVTLNVVVVHVDFTISQVCRNGKSILEAANVDATAIGYEWTNAAGTTVGYESSLDIRRAVEDSGVASAFPMTFFLTVDYEGGCSEIREFVAQNFLCSVQKGISANGDGDNDTFDLIGLNVNKLQVFNRYGMEVYSFVNYSDQWDGRDNNGNILPDGTYYYVIHTDAQVLTGWVYLIRNQ